MERTKSLALKVLQKLTSLTITGILIAIQLPIAVANNNQVNIVIVQPGNLPGIETLDFVIYGDNGVIRNHLNNTDPFLNLPDGHYWVEISGQQNIQGYNPPSITMVDVGQLSGAQTGTATFD
jgi:hypothetical protein